MEPLLTVAEVYTVKGQGLFVMPSVLLAEFRGKSFPKTVELRFKDGTRKQVGARFESMREVVQPPPGQLKVVCWLSDITKANLPCGTEVWATKAGD